MAPKTTVTPDPIADPTVIHGERGDDYTVATVADCDRHIAALTARIRRWRANSRYVGHVPALIADRDAVLDRRNQLTGLSQPDDAA